MSNKYGNNNFAKLKQAAANSSVAAHYKRAN